MLSALPNAIAIAIYWTGFGLTIFLLYLISIVNIVSARDSFQSQRDTTIIRYRRCLVGAGRASDMV